MEMGPMEMICGKYDISYSFSPQELFLKQRDFKMPMHH